MQPGAVPPSNNPRTGLWIAVIATVLALLGAGAAVGVYAVAKVIDRANDDRANDDRVEVREPAPSPTPSPTPTDRAGQSGACRYEAVPDTSGRNPGLPPAELANAARTVAIDSSAGPIELALDSKAPCAAHSFVHLAAKKYFDGTGCHRLTTDGIYVLQCGDPTGTSTGGPGYQFGSENLPASGATGYPAGTLAMANSGTPNSNGSQFFIVYRATAALGPSYTVLGRVTKGMDAILKVAAAGHDGALDPSPGGGKPKKPLQFKTVR